MTGMGFVPATSPGCSEGDGKGHIDATRTCTRAVVKDGSSGGRLGLQSGSVAPPRPRREQLYPLDRI